MDSNGEGGSEGAMRKKGDYGTDSDFSLETNAC